MRVREGRRGFGEKPRIHVWWRGRRFVVTNRWMIYIIRRLNGV